MTKVRVFGIDFDNLTTNETVEKIMGFINGDLLKQIVTVNMDFVARAREDLEVFEAILAADLVTADGMPIVATSKFSKNKLKERVTGVDITPLLIEKCAKLNIPVFVLGGEPESTNKALDILRVKYKGLNVTTYSPPFVPILGLDNEEILKKIEDSKSKLLFISLGTKAEKWARMNHEELEKIGVRALIGVGATFKFISGDVKRAPKFFQKSGLEWMYRLYQEPGYLWKRYLKDGIVFLNEFKNELIKKKQMFYNNEDNKMEIKGNGEVLEIKLFNKYYFANYKEFVNLIEKNMLDSIKKVVIDFKDLEYLDSKALKTMIETKKRYNEREFEIINISLKTNKYLKEMKFFDYFN